LKRLKYNKNNEIKLCKVPTLFSTTQDIRLLDQDNGFELKAKVVLTFGMQRITNASRQRFSPLEKREIHSLFLVATDKPAASYSGRGFSF
jgi:hypothetical protein